MYISKIVLENFKSFKGSTSIELKKGVNFFVGNNNSGKTTVFKAIDFLQSGKDKNDWITKGLEEDAEVSVLIQFSGDDIEELVAMDSLKKYAAYVFDENETKNLKIMRSSREDEWEDSKKKKKTLTLKNVRVYNPQSKKYENPSGIDSTISALFEAQFVLSDLRNDDYQDFAKTKIVGKLINAVTKDFQNTQVFKDLQTAHTKAFGDEGLSQTLKDLQSKLQNIISEQYGDTEIEFKFGLPEIENFFKTGQILLSDNGIQTDANEKGTGMQRALALSIIQLYSEVTQPENEVNKPLLFFIDEPETFLHPFAQEKLINALNKISQTSQILITTHSPYLLRYFDSDNQSLKIFKRDDNPKERIKDSVKLNLFPNSPTWGEINYRAFQFPSIEFHIELFGLLQQKKQKTSIKDMDEYLADINGYIPVGGSQKNINPSNQYEDKTLSCYIRNYFDHPGDNPNEPGSRKKPDIEDVKSSIDFMLRLLEVSR